MDTKGNRQVACGYRPRLLGENWQMPEVQSQGGQARICDMPGTHK